MRRFATRLCPALTLLLAACAAPQPPRTYTLVAPAASVVGAGADGAAFELLPVRVPAQVDLPQLVVRQGEGELRVLEHHRWAAPLAEEVRDALSLALSAQSGRPDLHRLARPSALAVDRLHVELRRFEARPGAGVGWDLLWSLRPAAGDPLVCVEHLSAPAGAGISALVAAHQVLVLQLAERLATVLRQPVAERSCPGGPAQA